MRQQIEARNPVAFAPKVVKHTTNSPVNMMVISNFSSYPSCFLASMRSIFEVKMIYRKKEIGRYHPLPGTEKGAAARSQSVLKNIVNVFRFVPTFLAIYFQKSFLKYCCFSLLIWIKLILYSIVNVDVVIVFAFE
jgi:hypothetical protein